MAQSRRFIPVDTLHVANKLKASGIESKQAEAVSEAINDVFVEHLTPTIFTKEDGMLLENKIETLAANVRMEIEKNKTEIIKWVISLFFGQTAIIVSVMTLIIKFFR